MDKQKTTESGELNESYTISLTCDESLGNSTGSSFDCCRRNIVDIMQHGVQLRNELQSIRHEFLGLLQTNPDILRPTSNISATKPESTSAQNAHEEDSVECKSHTPKLGLNSLQCKSLTSSLHVSAFRPLKTTQRVTKENHEQNLDSTRPHFFNSPVLDKTVTIRKKEEIPVLQRSKRKQFFDSPVLSKVARLDIDSKGLADSPYDSPKRLSGSKDCASPILHTTPGQAKKMSTRKSRRSSLQKLLSPMRRRSSSLERAKSRISIMTNGLLFNKNTNSPVKPSNKNSKGKIERSAGLCSIRPMAEGSERKRDNFKRRLSLFNGHDSTKTVELSSHLYSLSSTDTTNLRDSMHPSENTVIKKAIKTVTCDFITPISPAQCTQASNKDKEKSHKMNRINASELLNSLDCDSTFDVSDIDDTLCKDACKTVPSNLDSTKDGAKSIENISTIVPLNATSTTLREQDSVNNLTTQNILHSTFSYPLHSTMYKPANCSIAALENTFDSETINGTTPDLDFSLNNNTPDCDSSVLSFDIDSSTLEVKMDTGLTGNCNVCKVTQMRREMAQAHLANNRRRQPVGLSQTDLELESKLPIERPTPIGASQSMLDAEDQTLISCTTSQDETMSATIGSVPNFTALTELDDTRKATKSKQGSKGKVSTPQVRGKSHKNSSQKLKKSRRRSSKQFDENKENVNSFNVPFNSQRQSSNSNYKSFTYLDNSSTAFKSPPIENNTKSYISYSQKQELKRKFKSFNSSMNSSSHTTLAFF